MTAKDPLLKALDKIRGEITEKYGDEILAPIYDGTEAADMIAGRVRRWLPTELPGLDPVFGRQGLGYPSGRLIEMFGAEGHGKSSLSYHLLGRTQAAGGLAILLDSEGSYDPVWAKTLGVDISRILVVQKSDVTSLEWYFQFVVDMTARARSAAPKLPITVVLDTVYCCPTQEALDHKSFLDTNRVASLSRALSERLPSLCHFLWKEDVAFLILNQVRDNLGVMYGEKLRTPGGHALLHMCTIRVFVKRTSKKPNGAIESLITNVKNKVGPPFQKARILIHPKDGIRALEKGDLGNENPDSE